MTFLSFFCLDYPFGIRLSQRVDGRTLIMFNARNDHDRGKFCEDLREAILEMDEMEALRIEGELDKQQQRATCRLSRTPTSASSGASAAATPTSSSSSSSSAAAAAAAAAATAPNSAAAAAATSAQVAFLVMFFSFLSFIDCC